MKKLIPALLSLAAILSVVVVAGGYQPATPAKPQGSEALPQSAEATPQSSQPFLLSAKKGESVTLRASEQTQQKFTAFEATGRFADTFAGTTLDTLNAPYATQVWEGPPYTLSITEVFEDGSREVAEVLNRSDRDGTLLRRVRPDGAVLAVRLIDENGSPDKSEEELRAAGWFDPSPESMAYGLPLEAGSSKTETETLELYPLMSTFLSMHRQLLVDLPQQDGMIAVQLLEGLESHPEVERTVTVEFAGVGAAGQPSFTQTKQAAPWQQEMEWSAATTPEEAAQGDAGTLLWRYELLEQRNEVRWTYTPTGLPLSSESRTTAVLRLTYQLPDASLSATMQIEQLQQIEQIQGVE